MLLLPIIAFASIAAAKTCSYSLKGSIVDDPIMGWSASAELDDKLGIYPNKVLCGNGSGNSMLKQNDKKEWTIGCQQGFELTLSERGNHVTFKNGALTYEWSTGAKPDKQDCYGACQDKGGICVKCTEYDFTSEGGCQ
ncbi:hypothetical protein JX265_003305 [Neoarthrinium moseri]|uniref:Uncharacterized protein n=1 Tax=Neoarthrinium moseri TaxID=1658444 RepID=A0A9Q0AQ39_9PEZI|nr:hypothetical protein JX265_003305 [Neoarthrinium moseri]